MSFRYHLLVLVFAMPMLLGCNTIAGFGEDVEAAGEEIEEQADKHN